MEVSKFLKVSKTKDGNLYIDFIQTLSGDAVTRRTILCICIGALLFAPVAAQDFFVKMWEKSFSTTEQQEWIQCMDAGDLNNDGVPEIVMGLIVRPAAGLQKYAVQIVDSRGNKMQRWDSTYFIGNVFISDITNDGVPEIIVSGADLYILSNKAQNLNYPPVGTVVFAAGAADLDGDGKKELLVGTREIICRSDTLNWRVTIGSQIKKIRVADINWDGSPEIMILTLQNVHVLDKNGNKLWLSPGMQNLEDACLADLDGDRNQEILFSTANNLIYIWEAREDGLEMQIDLKSYAADVLTAEDINKDGTPEIITGTSKMRLEVMDAEGNLLWQYELGPGEAGDTVAGLSLLDFDGDKWVDILAAHSVAASTKNQDSRLVLMKNNLGVTPPPDKGEEYFASALEFFNKGNCTGAVPLFNQAKNAFTAQGNQEKASECQSYIDQCEALLAAERADSTFLQAEEKYQNGEYADALRLYKEAKSLYEGQGNTEKVGVCSERIEEIETLQRPTETPKEEEKEPKGRRGIFLVVIVIAALAGGSYFAVKHMRRGVAAGEKEEKAKIKEKVAEEKGPEPKEMTRSERIREEERKLKAQFVFGEINKEEYQEKLKKLQEE